MQRHHPLALACGGADPHARYWLEVNACPESWLPAAILVGAAIVWANLLVAAFVLVAVLVTTWIASDLPTVRRRLQCRRREARRAKLRRARQARLEDANVPDLGLSLLSKLVDEMDRDHSSDVDRFELDALLDRHAELAIAHSSCEALLRRYSSAAANCSSNGGSTVRCPEREAVLERQRACWERCKVKSQRLSDEMVALSELVELIVVRAITPELDADMTEIERRIARLDDEDAARRRLDERLG